MLKILKEEYDISEFDIEIIKLERIFVDKIFAAEFYYERNMYDDVSKHLYDISIMNKSDSIKKMLKNKQEKTKFWRISTLEDVANRLYQKLNFKNL